MIWRLAGTDTQRRIVTAALDRISFPFGALLPGLLTQTGRDHIPADWEDLSRYSVELAQAKATGTHLHVHAGDDVGHPIERRDRVLGLFWYSGRVTLDTSLEADPELAAEVFASEAAHAVDMFYMQARHRHAIWDALHTGQEGPEHDQAHGWFETPFADWAGGFQ